MAGEVRRGMGRETSGALHDEEADIETEEVARPKQELSKQISPEERQQREEAWEMIRSKLEASGEL